MTDSLHALTHTALSRTPTTPSLHTSHYCHPVAEKKAHFGRSSSPERATHTICLCTSCLSILCFESLTLGLLQTYSLLSVKWLKNRSQAHFRGNDNVLISLMRLFAWNRSQVPSGTKWHLVFNIFFLHNSFFFSQLKASIMGYLNENVLLVTAAILLVIAVHT